eukprot:767102-Hanusia_phi.AAC.7
MEGSILSPLSSAWSPVSLIRPQELAELEQEPPPWSRDLLSSTISLEYCKPWTKSGAPSIPSYPTRAELQGCRASAGEVS